jgi:diaminohydroxyphosphoribosylaminopyrimidine deaminase / 5-amino-6-(5-phosphoribosylamino)uracil reductase
MPVNSADIQFLQQALNLAREGIGLASPNPYVGAVIVDPQGNIVGTASYTYAAVKHAEVLALAKAGAKASGGTLYINLEPHAHQGRTPPCTDALISAGIGRVVASMADPNPKVSGLGFEKLRAASIEVDVGGLEADARSLNEAFARYIRHGVPLVTLKSAITLDGKIAPGPAAGHDHSTGIPAGGWITGEAARANVHQQRHQSDAIMVGVGTVLADDPSLTDRSGSLRRRPLLRVILDSQLRIPVESRLVRSCWNEGSSCNDVIIFCCSAEDKTKKKRLNSFGVRVVEVSCGTNNHPDFDEVLRELAQLEIMSVMIEGGSTVNGAALAAGIVDKIFLYYAPRFLAEPNAVPFAWTPKTPPALAVPRLRNLQLHRFGEDFAIEGYLRDPYEK